MKVISFKICPFVQRVTAFLEAKNISYHVEYISLQNKPEWFLDLSPNTQVPILMTDTGAALFESDAIVEYIDEVTQPLEPHLTPEQRAIDRAWSCQATKHYLAQCGAMRSPDENTLLDRKEKLGKTFAKAENQIVCPFFKGQSISNVDIAWLILLHRFSVVQKHTGYDFLDQYPKVKEWQEHLVKQELTKKSVADDFEEVFANFYLSPQTFLGQLQNKV